MDAGATRNRTMSYVVSGSTLELRKTKSTAGIQGPEVATTEKLKILGFDHTEYSIVPCVEIPHSAGTRANFTMKEQEHIKRRAPLCEHGCLAANDPKFEKSPSIEARVIDDAVQLAIWSGHEVFYNKSEVRGAIRPSPTTRSTRSTSTDS